MYTKCTDCMVEGNHDKQPTYSVDGLALCHKHKMIEQDKKKRKGGVR